MMERGGGGKSDGREKVEEGEEERVMGEGRGEDGKEKRDKKQDCEIDLRGGLHWWNTNHSDPAAVGPPQPPRVLQ